MSDIIRELEKEQLRTDLPELQVGDTVRVFVKVVEGNRERLQNFEGVVIKIQGGGVRKSFTVRRISYGIGVERTFPYNSPRIGRIEVVRHGVVRRAKLFYLRDRAGKAAKVREAARKARDVARQKNANPLVPGPYGQSAAHAAGESQAHRRGRGAAGRARARGHAQPGF